LISDEPGIHAARASSWAIGSLVRRAHTGRRPTFLLASIASLAVAVCSCTQEGSKDSGDADGATFDASHPDANFADSAGLDSGMSDAAVVDSGGPDAGLSDAGRLDGATEDAGTDDAGCGDGNALTVTPGSFDFGLWCGNYCPDGGGTESFAVTWNGAGVSGSLVTTINENPSGSFSLSSDACSGTSLASGQSCRMEAKFNFSATFGPALGSLVISSPLGCTTSATLSVDVSTSTCLGISPSTKDFGSVPVGQTSNPVTFTATSLASCPVVFQTMLSGPDALQFSILSNTCDTPVPTFGTCSASVDFSPSANGTSSAALVFTSAASTGAASLLGTGTSLRDGG
jgi:hypothetical protein